MARRSAPRSSRWVAAAPGVDEQPRRLSAGLQPRPGLAEISANPADRDLAEGNDALLAPLPLTLEVALTEADVLDAEPDKFGHAEAGRIEHLDQSPVPQAAGVRDVRCLEQAVDLVQREEPRERGKRARRVQIVGGILRHRADEPLELVEAPNARH
jgi:hypothetical protein